MAEEDLAKPRQLRISDSESRNGKAAKRPSHCEGSSRGLPRGRLGAAAGTREFGRNFFPNNTLRSPRALRYEIFGLARLVWGQGFESRGDGHAPTGAESARGDL